MLRNPILILIFLINLLHHQQKDALKTSEWVFQLGRIEIKHLQEFL